MHYIFCCQVLIYNANDIVHLVYYMILYDSSYSTIKSYKNQLHYAIVVVLAKYKAMETKS